MDVSRLGFPGPPDLGKFTLLPGITSIRHVREMIDFVKLVIFSSNQRRRRKTEKSTLALFHSIRNSLLHLYTAPG